MRLAAYIALLLLAGILSRIPDPVRPTSVEAESTDRAIATVTLTSRSVPASSGSCAVETRIHVANIGTQSFVITDLTVDLRAHDGLTAAWSGNSLSLTTEPPLSLGIAPLMLAADAEAGRARFSMDATRKTWHLMEPGRVVEIPFVQPVRGTGQLATYVDLVTQPVDFQRVSGSVKTPYPVRGQPAPSMPEWGEGVISNLLVFPYHASDILAVPSDCRNASSAH